MSREERLRRRLRKAALAYLGTSETELATLSPEMQSQIENGIEEYVDDHASEWDEKYRIAPSGLPRAERSAKYRKNLNSLKKTLLDQAPDHPHEEQEHEAEERLSAAGQEVAEMFDPDDEVAGIANRSVDFQPGGRVPDNPDYIFQKCLGAGGFGVAWLAQNNRTGENAVFKFCSARALQTLKNETELLRQIKAAVRELQMDERFQDGFVQMLDTHIDSPPYYVKYEYIPGGNLRQYITRPERGLRSLFWRPRFSALEAPEIMLQLAEKVALIHGLADPVIHRDLKPENILIVDADHFPPRLKVGDLGIGAVSFQASAAKSGPVRDYAKDVFCYGYASPEQMHNPKRRKASDDVHALGVIWYELLTNEMESRRTTGAREKLAQKGMTPEQIDFLQNCLDDEATRPKNAAVMAEEIRRLFPPLREQVQNDFEEILRWRSEGEDWHAYIKELQPEHGKAWEQAASQGLPEAEWLNGVCWQIGLGQKKEAPEKYVGAANWFRSAAEHGNAEAQYSLACYERFGLGGVVGEKSVAAKPDASKFLPCSLAEMDFSDNVMERLERLGINIVSDLVQRTRDDLFESKNISAADLAEVEKILADVGLRLRQPTWLDKAARNGQPDALYELWLERNPETTKKYVANDLLLRAANQGHTEARLRIIRENSSIRSGLSCSLKPGLDLAGLTDAETCLTWLREVAQKCHIEAQFLLGTCCEFGAPSLLDPNRDAAIEHYRKAAGAGHTEAQFRLARCLLASQMDEINKVAQELGVDENGLYCGSEGLGKVLELRPDLAVVGNEGVKWLMLAARGGLADAQFMLCRYSNSEVNEPYYYVPTLEDGQRYQLLCGLATHGHEEAKDILAWEAEGDKIFWHPCLVTLLRLLSDQGEAWAAFRLFEAYSTGSIRFRDYHKALTWLQKAADLGNEEAVDMILGGTQAIVPEDMCDYDSSPSEASLHLDQEWEGRRRK